MEKGRKGPGDAAPRPARTGKNTGKRQQGKRDRDRDSLRKYSADLTPEEQERIIQRRRRRREIERRKRRIRLAITGAACLLGLFLVIRLAVVPMFGRGKERRVEEPDTSLSSRLDAGTREETDTVGAQTSDTVEAQTPDTMDAAAVLAGADHYAAQYDYDKAMELIRQTPGYENNEEMTRRLNAYQETKDSCQPFPLDQVTHVFFHSLIVDPSRAFDGDIKTADYNQVMTTIPEFNKIMQSMYDKGYVLVSLHDMAEVNDQGIMTPKQIMLPPGKKAFVLSQDDVSYYHYMDGDGYATKLIIDENGEVKNEYPEDDGTILVGDYDMVPLLDTFVKEHPDFSYHGRKGILAMTGYDGVLGYRTDTAYKTFENLDEEQRRFLDAHPAFDFEEECRQAKEVADAMKADGWEFASHTWGHRNATESSVEQLSVDNEKWQTRVAPILGKTDVIIFAFGADIGHSDEYNMSNPKFAYFMSEGFRYYCPVDGTRIWVEITDDYLHQGRRNLDGYRMYYNPELVEDLFDAKEVFDPARPVPVPQMA